MIRSDVPNLRKSEIEPTPGRIRRLLLAMLALPTGRSAIADRSRGPLLQDGLWRGRCGALAKAAEIAMQTVAVECERKHVRT